jgi:hypothetical protein
MNKITKILLITVGFSMLTIVLGSLTSRPAPAQTTSTPVTVVNLNNRPVPTVAQGITTVAGSVAALQGGPFRVHAINALDTSNNPVPLIVQDATSSPFTLGTSCNAPTPPTATGNPPTPCEPGFPQQPNITLPTKSGASVVVIDFVSGACIGLETATIPLFPFQVFGPNVNTVTGQQNVGLFAFPGVPLTGTPQNVGSPGSNQSWFAQQTTIYAQPGSSVVLLVGVNSGCSLSVSGHFMP